MLMLIDADGKQQPLEAENFRLSVDPTGRKVKSTFFVPVMEKDAIILTKGRGFGDGIGMCQYVPITWRQTTGRPRTSFAFTIRA